MPVREAYPQRPVRDHLGQSEVGRLNIEVALYDLQVRRDAPQELERFFVGDVAEAEDLADFTGREELFELCALRLEFVLGFGVGSGRCC